MLEQFCEQLKVGYPFFGKKKFSKIFSWKDLNLLLNLRPFVNNKRLVIFNNLEEYRCDGESWLTDINTYPPSLLKKIVYNNHCCLIDCSRVNQVVNNICLELENLFQGSADTHIFFNLGNSKKELGIHYDYSHNFIIQQEGFSVVKIWDKIHYQYSKRNLNTIDELPVIEFNFEPGDFVFIPRHFYHEISSTSSKRMSLSFPISLNDEKPQDRFWLNVQ